VKLRRAFVALVIGAAVLLPAVPAGAERDPAVDAVFAELGADAPG